MYSRSDADLFKFVAYANLVAVSSETLNLMREHELVWLGKEFYTLCTLFVFKGEDRELE